MRKAAWGRTLIGLMRVDYYREGQRTPSFTTFHLTRRRAVLAALKWTGELSY